ncbi:MULTISPECIES: nitroreductase family protein [Saccharopolyspora]|uniref:nitroreductase family protein n=1 Tax=Saccharopolyspora TaxID=1835 RepID=UPI001CD1A648|nr:MULTISPECIES: nitroreductase family protein [Saccharopolyspora]MCA1192039.1 nitroreductase family protein [Saccharopolyspora sp. 6V]MCA1226167.1 nitroreductase family protein [Saccharopolyspora sp. 6M]
MTEVFEIPDGKAADSSAPLHPLLAARWSPRALDPAAELGDGELRALFEAARWAPSWGNTQPARFLAGRRGEPVFDRIHGTLSRGNKGWAAAAAALVVGLARTTDDEGEPLPYGEYGVALAAQNLVLQAVAEGLVAHQMAGFDRDAVRAEFAVPDGFEPVVAIAVGRLGSADGMPDRLREKEAAPRSRKALADLVFTERWGEPLF